MSSNQRLKHHQNKCNGLYSRQCEVCFRMFTTTQGKYQHNKYVKCKPPIQVQSAPHTINNINNIDNRIMNNTQNNNINVQLALNFGNEDLSGLINDPNYMKNVLFKDTNPIILCTNDEFDISSINTDIYHTYYICF